MSPFRKTIHFLLLLFTVILPLSAGGKTVTLGSSSPVDGAKAVPVDAEIVLTFTSNVVNFKVSDNNRGCFSFTDAEGNAVAFAVEMGDDQIDPDIKRIITLVPAADLAPGTMYEVTVSEALKAKNGSNLGDDLVISFTTAD